MTMQVDELRRRNGDQFKIGNWMKLLPMQESSGTDFHLKVRFPMQKIRQMPDYEDIEVLVSMRGWSNDTASERLLFGLLNEDGEPLNNRGTHVRLDGGPSITRTVINDDAVGTVRELPDGVDDDHNRANEGPTVIAHFYAIFGRNTQPGCNIISSQYRDNGADDGFWSMDGHLFTDSTLTGAAIGGVEFRSQEEQHLVGMKVDTYWRYNL